MPFELVGDRRPHLSAVADAALVAAGASSLVVAIIGLLLSLHMAESTDPWLVAVGLPVAVLAAAFKWALHGHRLDRRAALALAGGFVGGIAGTWLEFAVVGGLVAAILGHAAGVIAALAVAAAVLAAGAAFALFDAAQDLAQGNCTHRLLDVMRIFAAGMVVITATVVIIARRSHLAPQFRGALEVAVLEAVFGGLFIAIADGRWTLVTALGHRGEAAASVQLRTTQPTNARSIETP
jgi:hypothetical protein